MTQLLRPGDADLWINGGYFVLRREIFDVMEPGDELVEAPFRRLIEAGRLRAARYEGFWGPLDTLRDLEHLQSLAIAGHAPWEIEAAHPAPRRRGDPGNEVCVRPLTERLGLPADRDPRILVASAHADDAEIGRRRHDHAPA